MFTIKEGTGLSVALGVLMPNCSESEDSRGTSLSCPHCKSDNCKTLDWGEEGWSCMVRKCNKCGKEFSVRH